MNKFKYVLPVIVSTLPAVMISIFIVNSFNLNGSITAIVLGVSIWGVAFVAMKTRYEEVFDMAINSKHGSIYWIHTSIAIALVISATLQVIFDFDDQTMKLCFLVMLGIAGFLASWTGRVSRLEDA